MENKYRLKLVSRRDFNELYYKYRFPENSVLDVIEKAKDSDVLALKIATVSGRLHVFSAKIINEGTEELFAELLKKGVDALWYSQFIPKEMINEKTTM